MMLLCNRHSTISLNNIILNHSRISLCLNFVHFYQSLIIYKAAFKTVEQYYAGSANVLTFPSKYEQSRENRVKWELRTHYNLPEVKHFNISRIWRTDVTRADLNQWNYRHGSIVYFDALIQINSNKSMLTEHGLVSVVLPYNEFS